jgi:hypothetical protein
MGGLAWQWLRTILKIADVVTIGPDIVVVT